VRINYWPISAILVPTIIFIYILLKQPHLLWIDNPFKKSNRYQTQDEKYNSKKVTEENELNLLLEKIKHKGIDKLSKREKKRLSELSKWWD